MPLPEVTIAHPALPHAPLATTHTPLPAAPAPRAPGSAEHDFQASQLVAGERAPAYPEAFADSGRAGRVAVDCVIEVTGNPSHCRVVSASGGAAFAAETMRWLTGPAHPVYRPAIRDGQPRREDHQWVVSFQAPE
ncbi:MAG: energy transducer TonB [Rhodospirillales bacterium]